MGQTPERGSSFSSVWAIAEFRALWAAELFSIAGDQLARVALAVLVFSRTGSAALTALTYALTFVPALAGGVLLGGLGDRFPCREVMVLADLVRAILVAAMVLPGSPLWFLWVLVGAMTFLAGPFKAAQQAMLPEVLSDEEKYILGQSIRTITNQTAQLVGFAGGGALVALVNPSFGLTLDACTFLLSAVILRFGVRRRPAAVTGAPSGLVAYLRTIAAQARLVWCDRRLRTLLLLSWLAGFHIAPEALAAPYATSLGYGAGAVGLLMASDPAGSVVGVFVFSKWVPEHVRVGTIGVLGVLAGVPLMFCVVRPNLIVSMALFGLLGVLASAFIMQTNASFTLGLPAGQRSHGTGLFSSGLITTQGLGALAAGPVADHIGTVPTVALSGALGTIVAVPIAVGWHRAGRAGPTASAIARTLS